MTEAREGSRADSRLGNRPPAPDTPTAARRRWPHPALTGFVVVALVLTVIWAAGGFAGRKDLRITTEPGQLIATGPYEFAFTRATAQRVERFGSEVIVDVRLIGTGRTTGDRAIAPSSLSPMFVARDEATREIQEAESQQIGPGAGLENGSTFTPGLPPVEFTVEFEFPASFRPGKTLVFAIAELEFGDRSLLRTGEKSWNNGDRYFFVTLPLEQLPNEV